MKLIKRFLTIPQQHFFLLGPRGTGKSTFIKETVKNALWVDLLNPKVYRDYFAYPERLYELTQANSQYPTIVIDEVQRVPQLLTVVHDLIETNKQLQFILTGSSVRKLKRTGADLLAGRALRHTLHPFMASEMQDYFKLDSALEYGVLPVVYGSRDSSEALHAYVNLYLQEEIQAEGLVRNLDSFARFLEAISFSHASLLSVSNVARECGVKRKTVENYIEILEELLLAFRLPVFTKRAQRELISHSKFYLFDAGVFNILRPRGYLDSSNEIAGGALEGLVAQHLRAWIDYSKIKHSLSFWRTRNGLEVDFIVYGPNIFCAIEVKNSKNIHPNDMKSLQAFAQDYPEAKLILLYRGQEKLIKSGIICWPCEDFLLNLMPNQYSFV